MSQTYQVYVPSIDDGMAQQWVARLNTLGMNAEMHPEVRISNQSGFLPFKLTLERSAHAELVGRAFMTGFEYYVSPFDFATELAAKQPKPGMLGKLFGQNPQQAALVNPQVDARLKPCRHVLQLVWGAADMFELRMAMLSAVVLAELTQGIANYADSDLWHTGTDEVNKALDEVIDFESSLAPAELRVHPFERWL
ncbi:MAG: hypothetical protein ABI905_08480 [Betaproteobacteria bacterium]